MRDKKGILMEETLKIIVAVVCIVALVYLAFSLYGIFTQKKEVEQARATVTNIINKANVLKEGATAPYLVESPNKWYIVIFSRGLVEKMPAQCSVKETCLCMCNKPTVESCDGTATCMSSATSLVTKENEIYTREIPLVLNLKKSGGIVEIYLG
jgi:hypothetical protein